MIESRALGETSRSISLSRGGWLFTYLKIPIVHVMNGYKYDTLSIPKRKGKKIKIMRNATLYSRDFLNYHFIKIW